MSDTSDDSVRVGSNDCARGEAYPAVALCPCEPGSQSLKRQMPSIFSSAAMQRNVPKFSSFKPTAPAKAPTIEQEHRRSTATERSAPHRPSHHGKEEGGGRSRRDRRASPDGENEAHDKPLAGPVYSHEKTLFETAQSTNDLFIVDRRGDDRNAFYGSNDPSRVPSYREPSARRVLGRGPHSLDRTGASKSLLSAPPSQEQVHNLRHPGRLIRAVRGAADEKDIAADFVALHQRRKRKRGDEGQMVPSRASTEEAAESDDSGEAAQSEPESELEQGDADVDDRRAELQAKHTSFSKAVRTAPKEPQNWKALIHLQEEWLREGLNTERTPNSGQTDEKTLAGLKLSLYEESIAACGPHHGEHEAWLIDMMCEATKIWPASRVTARWKKLTEEHPNYSALALERIAFIQSISVGFDADACKRLYQEHFDRFARFPGRDEGSVEVIHALSRYTTYLLQSGQSELAVATWQSALELNFFTNLPSHTSAFEDLLSAFEDFWDTEQPRIGEEGANGWTSEADQVESPRAAFRPPAAPAQSTRAWAGDELRNSQNYLLPSRSAEDADSEDPFRDVLFSDIRPALSPVSETLQPCLLDAYLLFCNLPTLLTAEEVGRAYPWRRDPLCYNSSLLEQTAVQKNTIPIACVAATPFALFSEPGSTCSAFAKELVSGQRASPSQHFVRRSLGLLARALPANTALVQLSFAAQCHLSPSSARKTLKAVLKQQPSCLPLYNAYALAETRLGHEATAVQVLTSAVNMSRSLPADASTDAIVLWESLLGLAIRKGDLKTGLYYATCLASQSSIDPISLEAADMEDVMPRNGLLRAQQALTSLREAAIQKRNLTSAVSASTVLAMVQYLGQASDRLAASLKSYQSSEEALLIHLANDRHHAVIEHLHQNRAWLIHQHTHGPGRERAFKPSMVRSVLQTSVTLFPDNTLFPQVYDELATSFALEDRIRSAMEATRTPSGPDTSPRDRWIHHLAEVRSEMRRPALAGGTVHAVRAAFQRAARAEGGKHSPLLWGWWLRWEIETAEAADRNELGARKTARRLHQDATRVFQQALNAVPWCKSIALLGLCGIGSCWSAEDSQAVIETMEDRAIRLRTEPPRIKQGMSGA